MNKYRRISFLLAILICIFLLPIHTFASEPIKVIVNGKAVHSDVQPVLENGRTLVPLRGVFETLGAEVLWDGSTSLITITKGDTVIKMQPNNRTVYVNGQPVTLDVPSKLVNGRTLVPLRFVSETIGADVEWDATTSTVNISDTSYNAMDWLKNNYPELYNAFMNDINTDKKEIKIDVDADFATNYEGQPVNFGMQMNIEGKFNKNNYDITATLKYLGLNHVDPNECPSVESSARFIAKDGVLYMREGENDWMVEPQTSDNSPIDPTAQLVAVIANKEIKTEQTTIDGKKATVYKILLTPSEFYSISTETTWGYSDDMKVDEGTGSLEFVVKDGQLVKAIVDYEGTARVPELPDKFNKFDFKMLISIEVKNHGKDLVIEAPVIQ